MYVVECMYVRQHECVFKCEGESTFEKSISKTLGVYDITVLGFLIDRF